MIKRINLALQGGGAHGAFTWGVLDRLLEEDDLEVAAITGTSAGALNGAAFKAGMVNGGRDGARATLDKLVGPYGSCRRHAHASLDDDRPMVNALQVSPIETVSQMISPYVYGPFYQNPLKPVVEAFDYKRVCADAGPELHICATSVRTGKVRVFYGR